MANYVDAETQTELAGLTKGDFVRPEFLFTAPDTTTPPDEMLTAKQQFPQLPHHPVQAPPQSQSHHSSLPSQPSQPLSQLGVSSGASLLERRQNRPGLPSHISLSLDDEAPPSPPPTQAALSPLPVANKLHAGHTPLLPLSPVLDELKEIERAAPVEEEENQSATPQHDIALQGPLTLPTNPVDGAEDHNITLDALDNVLNQVAAEQERFTTLKDAPSPTIAVQTGTSEPATQNTEPTPQSTSSHGELPLSRQGSADSRRSEIQNVDGVILKTPPLNFGKPLGET